MYQLSHLLSEQRLLLSGLAETALLADETISKEIEGNNGSKETCEEEEKENKKRKLAEILEKIEGCSVNNKILTMAAITAYLILHFQDILDVPGRILIHHDDLVELDPIDNTRIQHIHGYLLSDSFMLAPWLSGDR